MRWIGAVAVFLCGGYFGFAIAASHKRDERNLRQIIIAIDYMECEMQYRLTPLPQLLEQVSRQMNGTVGVIFSQLALELGNQILPDVFCCMEAVLKKQKSIQAYSREALTMLGQCMGRFDLEGQLKELDSVRALCERHLNTLETNRDTRLRGYQTLGFCAGAALAILLL